LVLLSFTGGCSFTKLAADGTVDVMFEASPSLQAEYDIELGGAAIVGNLKLMDGLHAVVPDNTTLMRLASEAYGSYAYGWLEPQAWLHQGGSDSRTDDVRERAKYFYSRAVQYARLRLAANAPKIDKAFGTGVDALRAELGSGQLDEEELDAVFWTAHSMGLLIQSDVDDLGNMAQLPLVQLMMAKVREQRPDYQDGMPLVFFGMAKVALGAGLGGDMAEVKTLFEEASKVTGGRYLIAKYLLGRYYCEAVGDRACFETALQEVADADPAAFMNRQLTNRLCQKWARYWLANADRLF
jgi:hypothetical protein